VLSLYRRHRPRTFEQVVGQEHIVRTLRNAIELGKVHHAYLFVGSRGTGKTSMAKLLACALNADGGPAVQWDTESPVALAIMHGTSMDVVEMDAASNNSVDDIRELRENVALAPMGGGSRVYILDEAHMLTQAAWNAFLKTLEEPPPHVVFVLATTEAHKVPATIVDRCHRFDFQRPTLEQIAGVLNRVSAEEGIEAPDAAIGMLSRAATGSFRDALGTLEQLVTYGGKQIKLDDVLEILGVADAELVLQTADALVEHDPKGALLAVERLAGSGRDITQFMRDLAAHLRHLYVVQTLGEVPDSFSVTAEHTDKLAAQAASLAQGEVLRAIELLAAGLSAVKDGSDPRIQLELALLKAVQPQVDLSLQALLFRIEQLEARVRAASAEPGGGSSEEAPPTEARAAAAGGGGGAPLDARSAGSAGSSASGATGPSAVAAVAPAPTPAVTEVGRAEPVTAPPPVAHAAAPPAANRQPPPAANRQPPATAAVADLERIRDLWPAAVESVDEDNGMVAAFLAAATPVEVDGERLKLAFAPDATFGKKKCEDNRHLLQTALRALTGSAFQIECECRELTEDEGPAPVTLSHDELVERLKEQFGAKEVFDDGEQV
jgi:DNA polymerase III subunit gamma/tau